MPVVWIALQRFGTDKPATTAGRRDTDFSTEPITLARNTVADALDRWFVNTLNLVFVLFFLVPYPSGFGELSFDFTNDAAQVRQAISWCIAGGGCICLACA